MSVIYQDSNGFYYVVTNETGCWVNWSYVDPDTRQYYPYEPHILNNAKLIFDMLHDSGWSTMAICATLGNMIAESRMNPAQTQDGTHIGGTGGYGLAQWTPSSKYTNWARNENHDIYLGYWQVVYLTGSGDQWIINPQYSYNLSWNDYINYNSSDHDIRWLASAFFHNYERGSYLETYRQDCAEWYLNYFGGYTPDPPPYPPDPTPFRRRKKQMPLWMMLRNKLYET